MVTASKSPVTLTFREEDRGKTVYPAGRWKMADQKADPGSGIIYTDYSMKCVPRRIKR
jgi:hypothetical protein